MTGLITGICSMCGEKAVFNEVEFEGEVLDISLCCASEIQDEIKLKHLKEMEV